MKVKATEQCSSLFVSLVINFFNLLSFFVIVIYIPRRPHILRKCTALSSLNINKRRNVTCPSKSRFQRIS